MDAHKKSSKYLGAGLTLAGLFLGAGIAMTGIMGAKAIKSVNNKNRSVTVKGLSEKEVIADVATWRIPYRTVYNSREQAMEEALKAQQLIIDFGKRWQLDDREIWPEPISIRIEQHSKRIDEKRYENYEKYLVSGAVRMRSTNVNKIQKLTTKTAELLKAGVFLGDKHGNIPSAEYGYLSLNKIKPELIAAATQNARTAAKQFAEDSGQEIGKIQYANQGQISIVARDGTYYQKHELNKKVRVVTTVTYLLE